MTAKGRGIRERKYERKTLSIGLMLVLSPYTLGLLCLGAAILIFGSLRTIDVVGVHLFVLLLLLLGEFLPILALLRGQAFPLLADGLGKIGLSLLLGDAIRCFSLCLLTILATLATKEDKGVLRTLDVVFVTLLRSALYLGSRRLASILDGWWWW
jgi:hypothetical protein